MPENQPTPTHSNGVTSKDVPPTEVTPRAKRRSFSARYKLRILEEADACTEPGEVGALLRREGLYSSNLTRWRRQRRRQREQGQLQGLSSKKRGRKKTQRDEMRQDLETLRQEKQQLEERLEKAEIIIEVQKKLSTLLGLPHEQTARSDNR